VTHESVQKLVGSYLPLVEALQVSYFEGYLQICGSFSHQLFALTSTRARVLAKRNHFTELADFLAVGH
jgi:hypothetical protein